MLVMRDAVRLPGLLSLSRLPLGLLFPFVWSRPSLAIGLLAAAGVTDVLDGWCARRLDQCTATGAALDPLMDKAFVVLVVGTLIGVRAITPFEALLLSTRELLELPLVGYVVGRRIEEVQKSNLPGKVTTAFQFASILIVLVNAPHRKAAIAATALMGIVAGAAYWARAIRAGTPAARPSTLR